MAFMTAADSITDHPWYLAAQLVQPALIRLVDQLRQQLTESAWKSSYETVEVWPDNLPDNSENTETEPQILYWLYLTPKEATPDTRPIAINLWELCYQICFESYTPVLDRLTIQDFQLGEVAVDRSLFDDHGEVDWNCLDTKAAQVVKAMLDSYNSLDLKNNQHSGDP
ncbi:hypothetical protein RIF25_15290 [Thermosynechococcaceae cyanobacterium BACA0444]|uniref:Uncharacterized protein n=1 Tax=Pseudocalidococcus azoricus BACA0444 TaxID=2918990 RepID=A0AAE4FWD3_9CYAN|nr:hypothetical protein [Pseudocalidococcus azoricus]MDS3862165.1 hypothetical protein [Pseudocalidococcus azoricus BACA0444]